MEEEMWLIEEHAEKVRSWGSVSNRGLWLEMAQTQIG